MCRHFTQAVHHIHVDNKWFMLLIIIIIHKRY